LNLPGARWRRVGLIVLVGVLFCYIAALTGLFVVQRNFIYHPMGPTRAPDAAGPPIQLVRINTADGERLVGWWLPPQAGRPTLLFFNGNAAGLADQSGRWRRIAQEGVGFLAIAYRGYEGSTGQPTEQGLHQDALAAYGWLAERVPARDIVIHGYSLGSGVAVRLAGEKPARALVLEAPYTAIVDIAAKAVPWAPVQWIMLDQYRSRDLIGKVHIPLLVIHGDADSVVPFAEGQELFSMAHKPKTFVRLIGSDHNTLTRDGSYDYIWAYLGLPDLGETAAQGYKAQAVIRTET
jgi:fermentation-respiration switch protein FrsA (DUF1100 family)